MKRLLLLSMLCLTACASQPKKQQEVKVEPVKTQTSVSTPKPLVETKQTKKPTETYTRNELRKSCWRGVKKACGHDFSCFEKAGSYCEKTSTYRDIKD